MKKEKIDFDFELLKKSYELLKTRPRPRPAVVSIPYSNPFARLNFNSDFNSKLSCDYFTSIRSIDSYFEKGLHLGCLVDILLDREYFFTASLVELECFDLDNLSLSQRMLISLDTGLPYTEAIPLLKSLCGSNEVVFLLFHHSKSL